MTATPRPTGHPGYSQTLPRQPESAAEARRLVRTALAAWRMDGLIEDAVTVTSELVANSVEHARCASIRVIVGRPTANTVRLGVVDRSKVLPVLRTEFSGDPLRGRGLLIVDKLTARWGTELYPWGKQVWGEFWAEAR
ncbi:ATP-binding protein [Streptomyces bauhiniae]|uniref:ATP-binding protein n=1 Tax=Streptomyces bauhiniae TaxID=2340725 RepID=UPI0037D8155F